MRLASHAHRWRHLLVLLACAIVLAQALGMVHRTLHHPGIGGGHAPGPFAAVAEPGKVAAKGWAWLFADHDDDAKCRLFDSLGQGGGAPCVVATPLIPPAPGVLLFLGGEAIARAAALFEARGPPRIR